MRLIDADAIVSKLKNKMINPQTAFINTVLLGLIDEAPTVDAVEVVRGRWKYYHKQNKAVCTNCSFERDLDANFGRAISCPNCGAKMDVADINVGDKRD